MKMLRACFCPAHGLWHTVRMSIVWQRHHLGGTSGVILAALFILYTGAVDLHLQAAPPPPALHYSMPKPPAIKKAPKAKPPVLHQYMEVLPPVVPQVPDKNPRPVVWVI